MLPWEGVELFNTGNGSLVESIRLTVFVKSGIDLTSAHNHAIDFFVGSDKFTVLGIRDDPAEVRVASEILDIGSAKRMSEERFREEDA